MKRESGEWTRTTFRQQQLLAETEDFRMGLTYGGSTGPGGGNSRRNWAMGIAALFSSPRQRIDSNERTVLPPSSFW